MGTEPQSGDDAWIETVVSVAGALGANRMRVRWKLLRWRESRRKARRWREQRVDHIRYQHKTCPECGAVQDRDEAICTSCGAKLPRRGLQVLQRIGLTTPQFLSMSTLLALAMLGVYLRVWLAAGGGLGSPAGRLLVAFGGHGPAAIDGEPWRLVTAIFLHAGLWHLGFNLLAIATIGPRIEELYDRLTMLMLFVVTGTLGNLGSDLMGLTGVGIGASGGVMGLIGAAAGYGQRVGTSSGRALRNDMLKWSAYTIIFGFGLGADNWAHAFGAVTGAAFGYAVRPGLWQRPRLVAVRALGKAIGAAAAIGALAIIFTRTPPPAPPEPRGGLLADPGEDLEDLATGIPELVRACRTPGRGGSATAGFARTCDAIYDLRDRCRSGAVPADPDARDAQRELCALWRAELATLPERPARAGSAR